MANIKVLVSLILSIKDEKELEDFLLGLTTEKEQEELVQRIEIIKKLLNGESQHQIAADLKVGVATVTRGSKELGKGRFKLLREYQEQHKKHQL